MITLIMGLICIINALILYNLDAGAVDKDIQQGPDTTTKTGMH
jgi:hypothetical protein